MAMKWRDKREVCILSSTHDDAMVEVRSRGGGTKRKPQACIDYNDAMGEVDMIDQCIVTYSAARKRLKKYYQKLFHHLLDLAKFNSYVLYKKQGGGFTHLEFRLNLIQAIFLKYGKSTSEKVETSRERRSAVQTPGRLTGRHFPDVNPPSGKRKHGAKRCVVFCHRKPLGLCNE
ncbi:hypothetical protein J437_LFUL018202 [Ladona fulva]|uniref:PiggyBac transposable element-derived protein domain-containing protein n=1 Tax=Ladona fulva TaxID=123851 RepID=A0A8K0KRN9_LADFU|nr:hypothetical protein J437_LFUL018202 [Ladona fulva]